MTEMEHEVYDAPVLAEDRNAANRYWRDSPINPQRFTPNWNRTQSLEPEGELRGGVLLIHGLTDAPYSMRAVAEIYRRHGFYALCLRMPGHGTVPGALTEAHWEDWRAAARVGVRHVRRRIGRRCRCTWSAIRTAARSSRSTPWTRSTSPRFRACNGSC
jgi:alpha-beta hydrolase superfamily lysophospholipase